MGQWRKDTVQDPIFDCRIVDRRFVLILVMHKSTWTTESPGGFECSKDSRKNNTFTNGTRIADSQILGRDHQRADPPKKVAFAKRSDSLLEARLVAQVLT